MNNNYPFVSIIIPTRNAEDIIGQCLESLKGLNYPKDRYEVIVSDSQSSDKTPEIAEKYGAIYVSTPKRTISAGRNEGFKASRGEIIAFSDADCIFNKDWITNSLKYFKNSKIAGVGGINITPKDEKPFARAVGFVLDQALFSAGSSYGRILKKVKEVKSIAGCNSIFKRRILEKVFPLDENTLAEDYIMNQKIRGLGYKLIYTPDTVVYHYRRATPKSFFKQMKHYARCRLSIGKKNPEMINWLHIVVGWGIPIFLALSFTLITFDLILFLLFIFFIVLFFLIYFVIALFNLRSFESALFVPYAITILFIGWSLGYLKELFFPVKI